jgi:antitoxin CptB
MTGSTLSSDGLDVRRRKLLFRAWHRGTREMDLIMGRFADAHVAHFSEHELEEFERLTELPDPDLLAFVIGDGDLLPDHDSAMLRRFWAFHRVAEAQARS